MLRSIARPILPMLALALLATSLPGQAPSVYASMAATVTIVPANDVRVALAADSIEVTIACPSGAPGDSHRCMLAVARSEVPTARATMNAPPVVQIELVYP